jgi:hypothetical protein
MRSRFMKMSGGSSLSFICAFLLVAVLSWHAVAGQASDSQIALSKAIEINKQALAQLQAGKYEAAREVLWAAVAVLSDAKLGEHEIAAQTHVHLAAVYMTGFNDRNKAIRQFVMALKIDPDITITPQIETAALDDAFDAARSQVGLAPRARQAAPATAPVVEVRPTQASGSSDSSVDTTVGDRSGLRAEKRLLDREEPAPPAIVPAPLFCPLPSDLPPQQDLIVRCITQEQPQASSATLFYRGSGAGGFTPLPMVRSARGWLTATVPAAEVKGSMFQLYLEANVPGAKEPLGIGSAQSPHQMPIVEGAAPVNNAALALLLQGTETRARTPPTVAESQRTSTQLQGDESVPDNHRRPAGSLFFSLGGGAFGQTYHGSVKLDSHDYDPSSPVGSSLRLTGGRSPASNFQLVPEIGYQFSDRFALSLQIRYQDTPSSTSEMWFPNSGVSAPPTYALAFFLRGQYAFFAWNDLQFFASGVAGGGPRTFLGYLPKRECALQLQPFDCRAGTGHSDTVSGGPVAFGAGAGATYHISRAFAAWAEVRGITSLAPVMELVEYNAGIAVAHDLATDVPPPAGSPGWSRRAGAEPYERANSCEGADSDSPACVPENGHIGLVLSLAKSSGPGLGYGLGLRGGYRPLPSAEIGLLVAALGEAGGWTTYVIPVLFQLNGILPVAPSLSFFGGGQLGLVHYRMPTADLGNDHGVIGLNSFAYGLQAGGDLRLISHFSLRLELAWIHVNSASKSYTSTYSSPYLSSVSTDTYGHDAINFLHANVAFCFTF